jgi:hypothetical protein
LPRKTSGHFNKTPEQSEKKENKETSWMLAATNSECKAAVCCRGVALLVAATERETRHLAAITKGKTTPAGAPVTRMENGANPPGQFWWPGKIISCSAQSETFLLPTVEAGQWNGHCKPVAAANFALSCTAVRVDPQKTGNFNESDELSYFVGLSEEILSFSLIIFIRSPPTSGYSIRLISVTASSSCNITGTNSCFGRQTRDSSLAGAQCCNLLTQTANLVPISCSVTHFSLGAPAPPYILVPIYLTQPAH